MIAFVNGNEDNSGGHDEGKEACSGLVTISMFHGGPRSVKSVESLNVEGRTTDDESTLDIGGPKKG